ncbi:MAG: T9SS type A sorting domain-containing protein, partial [Bacteroidota bacterium]
DVLFSLVIRAEEDRRLSEVLSVNNRYTWSEAYASTHPDLPSPGKENTRHYSHPEEEHNTSQSMPDSSLGGEHILGLGVSFGVQQAALEVFALYQNAPNPFGGETVISFTLPAVVAEQEATLTILDATGRLVMTQKMDATPGYNSIIITKDQLNTSGVLTYTITAGAFTATKKMIAL